MRTLRNQQGFTVTEMLVGIMLAAVAGVVLFNVFVSTQTSYYDSRNITANQSELRIVMGMISQEIRSAGSDATNLGVDRLSVATDKQFTISSDLNADGIIDAFTEPAEQVSYIYDDTAETLSRQTGAGTDVLIRDVTGLALNYLDANGDPLGPLPLDPANRDLVRAMSLTISVTPANDEIQRNWTSVVAIRNDPPGI